MLRTLCFRALILLCAGFPAMVSGQTSAADKASQKIADQLPKDVQETLTVQSAWDKGFDRPAGSRLRFAKIGEVDRDGKHFARYRIFASGATDGEAYSLAGWNIGKRVNETTVLTDSAYVNRKGLLLAHRPGPNEENIEAAAENAELELSLSMAQGEPYRVVLRSRDNKTMIGGTLVPYPIAMQDKGCRLTAMIASRDANAVLIYADGFPPNTDLTYHSNSEDDSNAKTMHVNGEGRGEVIEMPYAAGKDSGTLKVGASSKQCSTSLEVPWGKGSYKPL